MRRLNRLYGGLFFGSAGLGAQAHFAIKGKYHQPQVSQQGEETGDGLRDFTHTALAVRQSGLLPSRPSEQNVRTAPSASRLGRDMSK
jgi:hypothetical protein